MRSLARGISGGDDIVPGGNVGGYILLGSLAGAKWSPQHMTAFVATPSGAEGTHVVIKLFREAGAEAEHQREAATMRRLMALPPSARVVRLVDASPPGQLLATEPRWLALSPVWEADVEDRILQGAAYDLTTAVRWGLQAAQALEQLHESAGACHGRINPRNVLVCADGGVCLTGAALGLPEGMADEYRDYEACVAPEVATAGGSERFDPASDVWSWGVMFHAVLAKSLEPHRGPGAAALFERMAAPMTEAEADAGRPAWAQALDARWGGLEVPAEATEAIQAALLTDPAERGSLRTIIRRLERAVARLEGGQAPEPPAPPATDDWLEVVCQCDERIFALRQCTTQDNKAVGEDLVRKGWAHQKLKRYKEAELCYRSAVTSFRSMPEDMDYNGIATALNNLASVHLERGEEDKALLLQEAVLRIRRNMLPTDHPAIASFLTNLGSLYELRKEYDKALPLYEEAAEIMKMVLPADHPDVASSINNIAVLHQTRGDYERALPLHEEALGIRRRCLPPDHPLLAASLTSLAMVQYCRGDGEAALPALREALDIQRKGHAQTVDGSTSGLPLQDLERIFEIVTAEVAAAHEPVDPVPKRASQRGRGRKSFEYTCDFDQEEEAVPSPLLQLQETPAVEELGVGKRVKRRKVRI